MAERARSEGRRRSGAHALQPRRNVVGRLILPAGMPSLLAAIAALWGIIVDGNLIPVLAPTGNSTVFQATTAAAFATLGILFGPWIGALGGLLRDGSDVVVSLLVHPGIATQPDFVPWLIKRAADIFEDVMLGLFPGLLAVYTRRVLPLITMSVLSAWISLPFLVVCNSVADWNPGGIWTALTTVVGDWDEPVDPGLTVYALLTGCLVALALVPLVSRARLCLQAAGVFGGLGFLLIILGAQP